VAQQLEQAVSHQAQRGIWMKTGIVLWALFFTSVALRGQESAPSAELLPLDQAIRLASENNRGLIMASLEVRKAEEALAAAQTRKLPVFDVNIMASQLLTRPVFDLPRGAFGTIPGLGPVPVSNVEITSALRPTALVLTRAIQPISQLYKVGLGVNLQQTSVQLAQEKLREQQRAVANNVKRLYYGILQTQSALHATGEALKLYREFDRVVAEYLGQQAVLKSDSLESKARLAKTEYDELALRNALATAKEQLNDLLGRDIQTDFRVEELPPSQSTTQDMKELRTRILGNRSEVKEAHLKLKQAEFDFRLKKSEYLPDVSLAFNYVSLTNIDFMPRNVAAIGLLFNWDVFDWGRKKHELAAKGRTIEQATQGVQEAEAQVLVDANSKYRKLQEAEALLHVTQLSEEVAREKLRVTMEKYAQQAALVKDVLQGQVGLADANHQYQQALLSYWTARADFEKAIGED
jgi:outer membrane protein